jgi:hypothetical protein
MKKILTPIVLLFLLLTILLYFIENTALRQVGNLENKYKAEVGRTVVLGKDTLTIVDYSILMENFTLSNGQKVSYSFVKNKK